MSYISIIIFIVILYLISTNKSNIMTGGALKEQILLLKNLTPVPNIIKDKTETIDEINKEIIHEEQEVSKLKNIKKEINLKPQNISCQGRLFDSSKYKSRSIPVAKIPGINTVTGSNDDNIDLYYIKPDKMTSAQLEYFKKYAKYKNMSINDYINWLLLFSNDEKYPNNNKYNKAMKYNYLQGIQLLKEDIPIGHNKLNMRALKDNKIIDSIMPELTRKNMIM
jgi:hypothetical protein